MTTLVSLIALAAALVVRGLVVSAFWHWFVVPLGVVPIETAHAIGISLLGVIVVGGPKARDNEDTKRTAAAYIIGVFHEAIVLLLCLGIGAIVHRAALP